jgi:hypothetical protein
MNTVPVGYQAITEKLSLQTLPHYRGSYIARHGRGKTLFENGREIHIYPKSYALPDENDLLANLEFALKYDGINLEIIAAFFRNTKKNHVLRYIQNQPTGIYARKIWYLYEFLMDDQLDLEDCQRIKYIHLLDPKIYFTGQNKKSSRHAIYDNLLGNQNFCPFVRRTAALEKYINLQLDHKVRELIKKYDPHFIARACTYLYTKETMSSYQIEREQPDKSRIIRFIHLLQQASSIESLSKEQLIELQNIIVDPRFKDVDYRHTQNYVGETVNPYIQRVHYVSPQPQDIPLLMQGLLAALDRMLATPIHPVVMAAAIAFGFVFVHPFEDGNGRIHRFLIHYILSKTGFTPKDMIFPVSSVMLQNIQQYDATLEAFSKPLLSVLTNYDLSDEGVMQVKQETGSFYKYIDFTIMAEYLFACIEEAIHNTIEQEIKFLVNYDKAKKLIQNIVDMPDREIDLLIKLILQNAGTLSKQKKDRFFPLLTEDETHHLTAIVRDTMIKERE